jgi:hypothetical protein
LHLFLSFLHSLDQSLLRHFVNYLAHYLSFIQFNQKFQKTKSCAYSLVNEHAQIVMNSFVILASYGSWLPLAADILRANNTSNNNSMLILLMLFNHSYHSYALELAKRMKFLKEEDDFIDRDCNYMLDWMKAFYLCRAGWTQIRLVLSVSVNSIQSRVD